jgi:hypothetical protein
LRKLALLCLGIGAALVSAAGASAGQGQTTTSTTFIQHQTFVEPEFSANPCTGDAITFNINGTLVAHETDIFDAGNTSGIPDNVWATFTETGKSWFTDAGQTWAGHVTVWGNFNLNEKNTNSSFTLTVKLSAPDGSFVTAHEVAHFAMSATGAITVNFDTQTMTCG